MSTRSWTGSWPTSGSRVRLDELYRQDGGGVPPDARIVSDGEHPGAAGPKYLLIGLCGAYIAFVIARGVRAARLLANREALAEFLNRTTRRGRYARRRRDRRPRRRR